MSNTDESVSNSENESIANGSEDTDSEQPSVRCWDCGSEEFRIMAKSGGIRMAECVECEGRMHPGHLYVPDPNGREHYRMEMER